MTALPLAIITGANGDMGTHITRAVAAAGYPVIMACNNIENALCKKDEIIAQTGNFEITVEYIELCNLQSVADFATRITERGQSIGLLMNNAGIMLRWPMVTENGLNSVVSVNYVAPYLLTRRLLPLMGTGSRIANMISCTHAIGQLDLDTFFQTGGCKKYNQIQVYSNTKLALLLFSLELAARTVTSGIAVNAVDPGIVNTRFIHMDRWFDPLADIFFRPCIRTPQKGAASAIHAMLSPDAKNISGEVFANCKVRNLSDKYRSHPLREVLWDATEKEIAAFL